MKIRYCTTHTLASRDSFNKHQFLNINCINFHFLHSAIVTFGVSLVLWHNHSLVRLCTWCVHRQLVIWGSRNICSNEKEKLCIYYFYLKIENILVLWTQDQANLIWLVGQNCSRACRLNRYGLFFLLTAHIVFSDYSLHEICILGGAFYYTNTF